MLQPAHTVESHPRAVLQCASAPKGRAFEGEASMKAGRAQQQARVPPSARPPGKGPAQAVQGGAGDLPHSGCTCVMHPHGECNAAADFFRAHMHACARSTAAAGISRRNKGGAERPRACPQSTSSRGRTPSPLYVMHTGGGAGPSRPPARHTHPGEAWQHTIEGRVRGRALSVQGRAAARPREQHSCLAGAAGSRPGGGAERGGVWGSWFGGQGKGGCGRRGTARAAQQGLGHMRSDLCRAAQPRIDRNGKLRPGTSG